MMYIKSTIWPGFEIKSWIEDQFQSSTKLVRVWTVLRCIFVPNMEIVTSIGGELWHGQAQNGVNFDFGVQSNLEGQGQLSHKTIGILTKLFLHLWSKFGDPSLNGWWVIARTNLVTDGLTDGRLREKHKCIVMRMDEDSSAYSESFKRVEFTNWEYRRVRATHQLPVPQTHWFAVFVW